MNESPSCYSSIIICNKSDCYVSYLILILTCLSVGSRRVVSMVLSAIAHNSVIVITLLLLSSKMPDALKEWNWHLWLVLRSRI